MYLILSKTEKFIQTFLYTRRLQLLILKILIFISTIGLFGCIPDKDRVLDSENLRTKTSDPSVLFFKNVRSPFYSLEENKEAGVNIYRLTDELESQRPNDIGFSIIHSWKTDNAYIFVEPKGVYDSLSLLEIKAMQNDSSHSLIKYSEGNAVEQALFASKIYNEMISGSSFELLHENESVELWNKPKRKEAIRILLYDYFNLTENL